MQTADSSVDDAEATAVVPARLHGSGPIAVLEVPTRGRGQARFERVTRRPAELAADLRRVDGVPPIVARPVRHKGLEIPIRLALQRRIHRRGAKRLCRVADPIDDLEVGAFVAAADVVL